jgi:DNA-binding GntR family transcriptional regulator
MDSTRNAATTRVETVRSLIHSDILAMKFVPGQRLRMAPLCERYGVSLSVVREALTRLVEQRLVVSEPQLGFTVVPVDSRSLRELTELRVEIEALALRWSVERGAIEWEISVTAALHRLNSVPRTDPSADPVAFQAWSDAHASFHLALASGCENRQLLDTRSILFDASELHRRWSRESNDAPRDVEAEHQAIANAALARSTGLAVELMKDHIRKTTERLLHSELASKGDGLP